MTDIGSKIRIRTRNLATSPRQVAIKISTVELPVRPLMPKEVAAAKTRLLEMHKAVRRAECG